MKDMDSMSDLCGWDAFNGGCLMRVYRALLWLGFSVMVGMLLYFILGGM